MIKSARGRVLLALAAAFACLAGLIVILQRRSGYYASTPNQTTVSQVSPAPSAETSQPSDAPTSGATPSPGLTPNLPSESAPVQSPTPSSSTTPSPGNSPPQIGFAGKVKLVIPVAGVRPEQLLDTFSDSRSEGRVHDAIDIPAPVGTPVYAVADGEIVRLFQSDRGGTTIYQLSVDKKLVFYYAHLQRYADGIADGKFVRQGEVIGFVGDTGNAGVGNYHLHFSIAIVSDPKRYWEGVNINPYPLLRN